MENIIEISTPIPMRFFIRAIRRDENITEEDHKEMITNMNHLDVVGTLGNGVFHWIAESDAKKHINSSKVEYRWLKEIEELKDES